MPGLPQPFPQTVVVDTFFDQLNVVVGEFPPSPHLLVVLELTEKRPPAAPYDPGSLPLCVYEATLPCLGAVRLVSGNDLAILIGDNVPDGDGLRILKGHGRQQAQGE